MGEESRGAVKAEDVIAEVELRWSMPCTGCERALTGHDAVISLLMGQRDLPRCAACLADGVNQPLEAFIRHARTNIRRLECYRAGWLYADRRLAQMERDPSACWASEYPMGDTEEDDDLDELESSAGAPQHAAFFDADDMSCGDLVLELRNQMKKLQAGEVLQVRAIDPGAPEDLPAWGRVTRNQLIHQESPLYWFRVRQDH